MEREIKDLRSNENININILQHISSKGISIETQISNIQSGKDTDVVINQFFQTSQDYMALLNFVELKKRQLKEFEEGNESPLIKEEFDRLMAAEQRFRIDALRLAGTLLKISPRTERLRKAYKLYNEGRFLAVDEILNEVDLQNDQEELLALMDYHEKKQEQLFEMIHQILTSINKH